MQFSDLFRNLFQPQLEEIRGSFFDRKEAIVISNISRGWTYLNGDDYERIIKLGRTILKEMSEVIWSCITEAYDAAITKPSEEEVRTFLKEKIDENTYFISENIVHIIKKENSKMKHPTDFESLQSYARREIEEEKDHLNYLLSGRINIFFGKLRQTGGNTLILKPTIYGIGIDLPKLASRLASLFKNTRKNKG